MNDTSPTEIRLGIMCTSTTLPAAAAETVQRVLAVDGVELVLLIVDETERNQESSWRAKLKKVLLGKGLLWGLYSRLFPYSRMPSSQPVDLQDLFFNTPRVGCKIIRRGKYTELFSAEDSEKIQGYRLDFVLKFAFGIIRGEILEAAKYGVWSFHHDDNDKYRGTPPAFWEIYYGDDVTGAILQRLTEKLDGGVILQKCFVPTIKTSYLKNYDSILQVSTHLPARVCRDLLNGHADYVNASPRSTSAPIFRAPNDFQVLRFMFRVVVAWISSHVRFLLFTEDWNVGIVATPIGHFLQPGFRPAVSWLPNGKKGTFKADPFAVESDSQVTILFEDFDYAQKRGWISFLTLQHGHPADAIESAIDDGTHMSYPFILSHEGVTYCIPEACERRRVDAYVRNEADAVWEKCASLIQGFPAVEPTVVQYEGRWWLFCANVDDQPLSALYIWHADDFLGPWHPHTCNPVKIDARSSRPAGTPFFHNGALYRPAQDNSRTYGGGITLNRVRRLSTTEFEEETIGSISPIEGSPYPHGIHTLSAAGHLTLIDSKRHTFSPHLFREKLLHKIHRLAGRSMYPGGGNPSVSKVAPIQ